MATSERSSASRHSSHASGHATHPKPRISIQTESRAVIHILEVVRHGQHGFFSQPRTTQTTQKDSFSQEMTEGTAALIRQHAGSATRRAAVVSVLSVLSVARVVRGACNPWLGYPRPVLIRGTICEHALTHCPPCVHPDRCPHSRGAQRPEQGTGTAAGLRKVRDARAAAAGRLSPDGSGSPTASTARIATTSCVSSPWRPARRKSSRSDRSRRSRPIRGGWPTRSVMSEAQEEKLRQQKKPIQRKLGTLQPGLGRHDDRGWHRVVRLQRQRNAPGDEALRARTQGCSPSRQRRRRGTGRRDAHRPRAGNGPRYDIRQRDRVRLAGQGQTAGAHDQRRGQDRQRRPALRSRDRLAARARFRRRDLHGVDVAQGSGRSGGPPELNRRPPRWRRPMRSWRGGSLEPRSRRTIRRQRRASRPDLASSPFRRPSWSDDGRTMFRGDRRSGTRRCQAAARAEGR